jgi:hypothetical protein
MVDKIIVHWNTESPKKYVARVERMYSATIPDKPVAKRESLRIPDLENMIPTIE